MARRAIRDTYGLEQVGPDTYVRRLVKAGQFVPDELTDFDDESAVAEDEYVAGAGLGGGPGPAGYPHQRGLSEGDQKDLASGKGKTKSTGSTPAATPVATTQPAPTS
jgi:hypothetical protein